MASVASQLIEEVTAHAQSDSLEDAREICADGTYFPNDLRTDRIKPNYSQKSLSQYHFVHSDANINFLGGSNSVLRDETLKTERLQKSQNTSSYQ